MFLRVFLSYFFTLSAALAFEWRSGEPTELGLDAAILEEIRKLGDETPTDAILIIRHGSIGAEFYFGDATRETLFASASVAKSYTSAVVGIALHEGKFKNVDQPAVEFLPRLADPDADPEMRRITIRHLLTMTSGLGWNQRRDPDQMRSRPDWLDYIYNTSMEYEPGTHFNYSASDPMLLSAIIEKVTGKSMNDYAREVLFTPLGISNYRWAADSEGHTNGAAGLRMTARDYAKLGLLYLKRGKWDGTEIVPPEWLIESTRPSPAHDTYGYLWWLIRSNLPEHEGAFTAAGAGGQYIIVMPKLDLVAVRMGDGPRNPNVTFLQPFAGLLARVCLP